MPRPLFPDNAKPQQNSCIDTEAQCVASRNEGAFDAAGFFRHTHLAQQRHGASEHPLRLETLVAVPVVAMSEPIPARKGEGARGSPVLVVTKVQLSILQADYCIDILLRATGFFAAT